MKILYLAADAVPAPKGAAVRIRTTVRTLKELGHEVELFTPAGAAPSGHETVALPEAGFLERMMELRKAVDEWLRGREADLVQFRGIWEGVPAVAWARRSGAKAVFEAHGFPSIELHYHYPGLAGQDRVLRKIIAEEQALLGAVDRVVTPSATGARFLEMRGVRAGRIDVIPNAVDPELFSPGPVTPPPEGAPLRLVYAGTLSPWQGLPALLEAVDRLRGGAGLELHVVGPAKSSWRDDVRGIARRLRVHRALHLSGAMEQADLVPVLRTAHVCVAPLPADPRNSVQGCCPIKILEYMAAGRPVLSTLISPVEEILEHERTAWLVEPGSPAALAEGIAWMREHPREREQMGARARQAAIDRWSPGHFRGRLRDALDRLSKRVV